MTERIATRCGELKLDIFFFIEAFLWIALVAALIGTVAEIVLKIAPLFGKARDYPPAARTAAPVDPVKFLDALKGLIDALTKAPAWVAIFLAALALLWAAKNFMPGC